MAEAPTEENYADAALAAGATGADAPDEALVPEHRPESEDEAEARLEAEATDSEKKTGAQKNAESATTDDTTDAVDPGKAAAE
ncbi:MAG: hypothetical protein HY996_01485 [Micrococcales bacterium]|nr:hypothetical protein [Micrococcales bacterium]